MVTWAHATDNNDRVLTRREAEVTILASFGLTAEKTAKVLGCAITTVRVHRRQVIRKTQAKNMTHAVATLMRQTDGRSLPKPG